MQSLLICKNLLTNILSQERLFLEPNAIVLEKCLNQRGIKTTQEHQDFNYCDLIIFGGRGASAKPICIFNLSTFEKNDICISSVMRPELLYSLIFTGLMFPTNTASYRYSMLQGWLPELSAMVEMFYIDAA